MACSLSMRGTWAGFGQDFVSYHAVSLLLALIRLVRPISAYAPCGATQPLGVGARHFAPCPAIVQCAVSVRASSSTGASSDTAVAVVVVSSQGSGLRVIARASTSSMRETGTISSPLLM